MTKASTDPLFRRIVVGTDGSDQGHDAAALGAMIAAASGADVSLLAVYPTSLFAITGMPDGQAVRRSIEKSLQSERLRWNMPARVNITSDFSVPHALTHHAEETKAELIVVGSGNKAKEGTARISSRSRQLLGSGRFGLAIARRGLAETNPRLRAIGVGYDGGAESELALDVAARLARGAGAELRVLSVVDDRLPLLTFGQWMTVTDADLNSMWDSQLDQANREAQEEADARGTRASVEAVRGEPARRLREFSRHLDLLVIGSRRWGALARVVAGSVGEALVSESECSLLMVPRPATSRGQHVRSTGAKQTVAQ